MLYVEDNPANLKLMETLIDRMAGITMVSAHTGELGLELAEVHKPDVIILDINLPGINGFQALRRLKESEATRDIPVIALTANAKPSEVKRGLKAGFHRYLTKPIRIHEITAALESALDAWVEQHGPRLEAPAHGPLPNRLARKLRALGYVD